VISTRKPFRINVGFLINQPVGYLRALPFEFEEIDLNGDLSFSSLTGTVNISRTYDGFRAQMIFDGEIESECGRCLEPFQSTIHIDCEEFFTFPYVDLSEDEIKVPEDGNIDLEPILYDYMLMEIPINPVCSPDCKGLCVICGKNLNTEGCIHHTEDQEKSKRETSSS